MYNGQLCTSCRTRIVIILQQELGFYIKIEVPSMNAGSRCRQILKYLSCEEMGTVKRSRNPKTVITANGQVQTSEEAQVLKSLMTCLRSCHLASSVKNTVIPTSGPTPDQTKEEDSLQVGKFRTSCCVKTTPQKTRFRDVKYARIWDTD